MVKLSPQKCNTSTTAAVRMLAKECVKVLLTCSVVATVILVLTVVKSHPPNHGSELLAVKHYPPLDVDLRTLSQTQVICSQAESALLSLSLSLSSLETGLLS